MGYYGFGFDDMRYLAGVRCWAEAPPCVGGNHWELRHPLVVPTALVVSVVGVSRASLAVVPALYYAGSLALLGGLVRSLVGPRIALLAVFLLATTPTFTLTATSLNVNGSEVFYELAAVAALVAGYRAGRGWYVVAGVSLALALTNRATSLGLCAALFLCAVAGRPLPRTAWLWVAAGAAPVWLAEHLWWWGATGDLLWHEHADLRHTTVWSARMEGGVRDGSPLFKVASWRPYGPLPGPWWLHPYVNLLLHARWGFLFGPAVATAVAVARGRWAPEAVRRVVGWCWFGAVVHWVVVIYVLAVDPNPRMSLPLLAALSVVVAVGADHLLARGLRLLVPALGAFLGLSMIVAVSTAPDLRWLSALRPIVEREPGPIFAHPYLVDTLEVALPGLEPRISGLGTPAEGALVITVGGSEGSGAGLPDPPPGARWTRVGVVQRVGGLGGLLAARVGWIPAARPVDVPTPGLPTATVHRLDR